MAASIIIPTYNEKENIGVLIGGILEAVPEAEVIVVDDNSPDKTWQFVEEMAKKDKGIVLIRRADEKGLASAIQKGIDSASNDIVGWMDSDLSMPPILIPEMIKELESSDIVIGSRYAAGGADKRASFLRILCSRILNDFARLLLGTNARDLTSGFVVAKKKVFRDLFLSGVYGEYCIKFLYEAERKGYKTRELAYVCNPRFKGETKTAPGLIHFFTLGLAYLAVVFRLSFFRMISLCKKRP